MTTSKRQPRAVSLLELLVVLGVIAILASLILPAVNASRQASLRTQCANHLKQLGLAVESYHGVHACYPPGRVPAYDYRVSGPQYPCTALWVDQSPHARLLPFMDEQPLYDQLNSSLWVLHVENQTVRSRMVRHYICPSETADAARWLGPNGLMPLVADRAPEGYVLGQTSYRGVIGDTWSRAMPAYLACQDSPILREQANGLFHDFSPLRQRDVVDGLSQTLLMAESSFTLAEELRLTCFVCIPRVGTFWAVGDMKDTLGSTLTPPNYLRRFTVLDTRTGSTGFSSQHSQGLNALMADGSVRFINDTIDSWTLDPGTGLPVNAIFQGSLGFANLPARGIWQALATRNGGEVLSE